MSDDESKGFLDRIPGYAVPAFLIGVPVLAAIISALIPAFYENVIWQYYWGPIKADAMGREFLCIDGSFGPTCPDGPIAQAGYNMVNTLSWAVLMGAGILGITQLITALKVKMNNTVILGATGWVVAGAVWHVIEDAELFARPMQFFFITPPIYLLYALGGILSIILGAYLQKVAAQTDLERALQKLWFAIAATILVYTFAWSTAWDQVVFYVNPVMVALAGALTYFLLRLRILKTRTIDPRDVLLGMSAYPFIVSLVYVWAFIQEPWHPSDEGYPQVAYLAPLMAAATAGLVYLIAKRVHAKTGGEVAAAFIAPVNLLIIFSQMVDAFATSYGLDLRGYREKHVLSGFVIDTFRDFSIDQGWEFGATYPTFLAFAPLKLAVSILVVYAIDVYSKEDVKKYPALIGFVKFGIIMVGIGPGVRNFVRLALGI